jgi:release factor glutamine methyltransferase
LKRVIADSAARLNPGGRLIVEFGYGQEEAVVDIVQASRELSLTGVRSDLQGIPRTAIAARQP